MTLGKFRQAYAIAAIVFLNTVLLFAALNLAIQARRSLRSFWRSSTDPSDAFRAWDWM